MRYLNTLALCAFLVAGCGISEDELLMPSDTNSVYEGGGGGGNYGIDSEDPSTFGTISGTVVYKGRPFRKAGDKVDRGSDKLCINLKPDGLLSEDFLMGANGELGNVIVYIKRGVSSWGDAPTASAVLDQKACQYIPHILIVRTGQEIIVKNSDAFLHNVKASPGANQSFNRAMGNIGQFTVTFNKPEMAKRFGCDVHGWMVAHVAVLPHPFHAITGADGKFEIKGVPPGRYQLAAWHEQKKIGEVVADITVASNGAVTQDFTLERN